MEFLHILALMMPVLVPVVMGQIFVRVGIFRPSDGDALLKYLLYATFPALIIGHLAIQPFSALFQPAFTGATLVFIGVMYAGVFVSYRSGFRRPTGEAAMAALTGSFVSAGIVGLPIMLDIIGPTFTTVPVIVNTVLSLVTIVPLTILLVAVDGSRASLSLRAIMSRTFVDVMRNPLVLAAIAGLLLSLFAVPTPAWFRETFDKVGEATFATSLFAVGVGINLSLLRANLRQILVLSFFRVVVSSGLGFLLAAAFKLQPGYAISFVIMASLPTAKSVPPIAQDCGVFAGESVQVVTLTTLAMVVSIPIVCYLSELLWPGIIR